MDALSEYLNYIDYLPTLVAFFALIQNWKDINIRWFLILGLTVGVIDNYSMQYAIHWTTHFYAWAIFVNLLLIVPVVFRKQIAHKIYNLTGFNFFYEATKYKFSQHEAAIVLICFISIIGHGISYVEVFLYKSYIIDVLYFKSFVLGKLQLILHILSTFVILSLSFKLKGLNYEANRV
ncbi:MAG: hypothetical protein CMK64_06095 [Pseudoalteromonas sp.]|nr:hypothetical protein [Pseudoalteromonas sp.]|tara:strand:- start:995 stop:1528 length:534 start_codon:yes stop_codon:yes gene_type:complete